MPEETSDSNAFFWEALFVQEVLVGPPFHYEALRVTEVRLGSHPAILRLGPPASYPATPKHRASPPPEPTWAPVGKGPSAGICLLGAPHQEQLYPQGPSDQGPCPGEPGLVPSLIFLPWPSRHLPVSPAPSCSRILRLQV